MIVEVKVRVAVGRNGVVRYAGRVLGRVWRDEGMPAGERWCAGFDADDATWWTSHRTQRAALLTLLRRSGLEASS